MRVLLIEDDPGHARLIREVLAEVHNPSCKLEHVERLASGLAALAAGGIDVVLVDLSLPDSQGFDTFARVHTQAPDVPIVVLTGLDDEAVAVKAVQKGAQDYLNKREVLRDGHFLVRAMRYAVERKRLERIKDEFLGTVSHELRTPLTIIKEFTTILSDHLVGPLTPAQQKHLAVIRENIERLARIIKSLLEASEIQAGHVAIHPCPVAVHPLLERVVDAMRPLAEHQRLHLDLDVPERALGVLADPDHVTHILLNLVGNAIKFTEPGGRIQVSVAGHASEVEFCVSDTGVGIAPEHLPQLFEHFQQFRRGPTSGGTEGTGLGLAISKRLVELQGGRIQATSEPGRGSVFAFTLPRIELLPGEPPA